LKSPLLVGFSLFFIGLILSSFPSGASNTRVDATGGLDMVLTDETTEINPYNLGNPAGLALLPTGSRLEFSLPYYGVSTASKNINNIFYGISPSLNLGFPALSGLGNYQGFLDVLGNGWAFHGLGTLEDASYTSVNGTSVENYQSGQELFQAAKQWGRFSTGAQFSFNQTGSNYNNWVSQSNFGSQGSLNLGANYNLPLAGEAGDKWLRLGTSLTFEVAPDLTTITQNIPSPPFTTVDTLNVSNEGFQPAVILDLPGFQAGFQLTQYHFSVLQTYVSSNTSIIPNQDTYLSQVDDLLTFMLLEKWRTELSDLGDVPSLYFVQGGQWSNETYKATLYESNGNLLGINPGGHNQFQLGMGLERPGVFTLGLQLVANERTQTTQAGSLFVQNINTSTLRLTLGGEKWISPRLALRLGFSFVDENSSTSSTNNITASWDYFNLNPGQEITGVLASTGFGYQTTTLRLEGLLFLESPQSTGTNSTGSPWTYTVFGGQLSFAWYINN